MTLAIHTPYDRAATVDLGRHLFRKQILRKGSIDYKGRKIDFSDDYLQELAQAFNQGAFDQVAFQLANDTNDHTLDPERTRGEIKAVEVTPDGLDAIVQTTDAGAQVVRDNPRLGVSARIVEGLQHADGRSFPRAIQHVLGTLDPRVTGMRPWEAVTLSNPSDVEVIDLTQEGQMPETPIPDDQRATLDAWFNELAQLAPELTTGDPALDALTEQEQADLEAFVKSLEDEPAGASLSAEDRQAIDLARAAAETARAEAAAAQSELNVARFEREKQELVSQGIPPAAVDLAMPLLLGNPGTHSIELSNGTSVDPGVIVRGLLGQMKGTVDLSKETVPAPGRPMGDAEADLLKAWETQAQADGFV